MPVAPGLRLAIADRWRVDARLLRRGTRVDGIDDAEPGGRRVRIACIEPAHAGDTAVARLAAWEGARGAGLPVCRALYALDDEPGPLLVLEPPPPPGQPGSHAELARLARELAHELAGHGLRAGAIPAGDLVFADDRGLVVAVPPPLADGAVDAAIESEALVATASALVPVSSSPPAEETSTRRQLGDRLPARRLVRLAAGLALVAAAAVLALPGGRDDAAGEARLPTTAPMMEAGRPPVRILDAESPSRMLRETASQRARRSSPRAPATRTRPVHRRPRAAARVRPLPQPAPEAVPAPPRVVAPPPSSWSLGPGGPLAG